jgi:hypothetical protein
LRLQWMVAGLANDSGSLWTSGSNPCDNLIPKRTEQQEHCAVCIIHSAKSNNENLVSCSVDCFEKLLHKGATSWKHSRSS